MKKDFDNVDASPDEMLTKAMIENILERSNLKVECKVRKSKGRTLSFVFKALGQEFQHRINKTC
jgi:hypothetical protein